MCETQRNTAGRLLRLPELQCISVSTIEEAIEELEKHKGEAKVLAGGTDILNQMKRRTNCPKYLINIKTIEGLDKVEFSSNELIIGATATFSKILNNKDVRKHFPMLAEAVAFTATPQIRNSGTMMGNICNAVPSADSIPPLIALDAKIKVVSANGEKMVPVEDFVTGNKSCSLEDGEIATEIVVPYTEGKGTYIKHQLRAEGDLAVVGIAVYLKTYEDSNTCKNARIVLGAVGPKAYRAKKAEAAIIGQVIDPVLIEQVAEIASEEARPISDIRSSAWYRKEMVKVHTRNAINNIMENKEPNIIL